MEEYQLIDLTHRLTPDVPTWNGSCGYCLEVKKDYDQMFRVHKMKMHAGVGTHMDAPSHCIQGGKNIGDLEIKEMIAPLVLIDVRVKVHTDYEITVHDLEEYEKKWEKIPKGACVIGYTGWSKYWGDPDRYRNIDKGGQMHFPAFHKEAAEFLLERGIAGLAIDTLSPDCLDQSYPVHHAILGAGKYIIENVADCAKIPPKGATVIALPIKADGATEAPIRMIGLLLP
ncbi:MAG: cyclase family protein [Chlamydiales bacterium]|nr:cyclase family protein [Chlamydiales bacterium]